MQIPDLINGAFELWGGIAMWLNVRQLWKDKEHKGVFVPAQQFFFVWGLWNLFYYPSLHQIASFIGGLCICSANFTYVYGLKKFKKL